MIPAAVSPPQADPYELVCPACRHRDDQGRLHSARLVSGEGLESAGCLCCPGCGQRYPVVDGIPVVLAELDTYLSAEAPALLARADLPVAVEARLRQGASGPLRRDAHLRRLYEEGASGDLYDWARAQVLRLPGAVLHLGGGCSELGLGDRGLHMDLNFALLRRGASRRRVVGDALNPPLWGGVWGGVVALNLLDSCRQPWLLLQQVDALLRPGGGLVLSCAFAWQEEVTAPTEQITEAHLHRFLAERGYAVEVGTAEWILRHSARSLSRYEVLTVYAQKPGLV